MSKHKYIVYVDESVIGATTLMVTTSTGIENSNEKEEKSDSEAIIPAIIMIFLILMFCGMTNLASRLFAKVVRIINELLGIGR